jgi:DNA polymerase-3 subunit epsilon
LRLLYAQFKRVLKYLWHNINVHGIISNDTRNIDFSPGIYPEIKKRLLGKKIVAHSESFDRNVLFQSMKLLLLVKRKLFQFI